MLIVALAFEFCYSKGQQKRLTAGQGRPVGKTSGFDQIFIFTIVWVIALVLYFTEAYIDFTFNVQIWITSVPIVFTFLIICVVIKNLQQIYEQLTPVNNRSIIHDKQKFVWVASFSILTQILNPLLATFETYNEAEVLAGLYEHNWEYFTRNALTTLSIVMLSVYVLWIGFGLAHELNKYTQFKGGVRIRTILLSTVMEIALCLRLFMIWSQNTFWYMPSQSGWLFFTVSY